MLQSLSVCTAAAATRIALPFPSPAPSPVHINGISHQHCRAAGKGWVDGRAVWVECLQGSQRARGGGVALARCVRNSQPGAAELHTLKRRVSARRWAVDVAHEAGAHSQGQLGLKRHRGNALRVAPKPQWRWRAWRRRAWWWWTRRRRARRWRRGQGGQPARHQAGSPARHHRAGRGWTGRRLRAGRRRSRWRLGRRRRRWAGLLRRRRRGRGHDPHV